MFGAIINLFSGIANIFNKTNNTASTNAVVSTTKSNITPAIKDKIIRILRVMETGRQTPRYDLISVFADGPTRNGKRIRQITYGALQTTEFGNLRALIEHYISLKGQYSEQFKQYVDRIGRVQLVDDMAFRKLLVDSAKDPKMQEAQDWLFEEKYWKPAYRFFKLNKFTLPLSMLIIFDSYIHSGSILQFLRNRFPEKTPGNGGDEKKWITQYIEVRHNWLANHTQPILRKTIYRTRDYIREVRRNNWALNGSFSANGVIVN